MDYKRLGKIIREEPVHSKSVFLVRNPLTKSTSSMKRFTAALTGSTTDTGYSAESVCNLSYNIWFVTWTVKFSNKLLFLPLSCLYYQSFFCTYLNSYCLFQKQHKIVMLHFINYYTLPLSFIFSNVSNWNNSKIFHRIPVHFCPSSAPVPFRISKRGTSCLMAENPSFINQPRLLHIIPYFMLI